MLVRSIRSRSSQSLRLTVPLMNSLSRFYHSYPDPDEIPIITHYTPSSPSPSLSSSLASLSSSSPSSIEKMKERFSLRQTQLKNESLVPKRNAKAFVPEITKLENGLTVVSTEADDMTMSSFAFLIKSGRFTFLSFLD
jgi:hypothetical protein